MSCPRRSDSQPSPPSFVRPPLARGERNIRSTAGTQYWPRKPCASCPQGKHGPGQSQRHRPLHARARPESCPPPGTTVGRRPSPESLRPRMPGAPAWWSIWRSGRMPSAGTGPLTRFTQASASAVDVMSAELPDLRIPISIASIRWRRRVRISGEAGWAWVLCLSAFPSLNHVRRNFFDRAGIMSWPGA